MPLLRNQRFAPTDALSRRRVLLALAGLTLAACSRPVTYSQPEPGFLRYHADDVVQAFRQQGLAVSDVTARPIATPTPIPDLIRQPKIKKPVVEVEDRTFEIPGGAGGEIFIFDSSERLRAKHIWFARFPDLYPYVYEHANVLLVLDQQLSPEVAATYRAALETLP